MYISIGNDMAVRDSSIVGIFDLDNCSWSLKTRQFLENAEKNGEVIPVANDLPKSFILATEYGINQVYLVQPNTATLQKRGIRSVSLMF